MKAQNIIFLIIINIVFAISCQEKPPVTYTIKGKLLKNCGGEVMGNADVEIQSKQGYSWTEGVHIYAKTDNEGNFSISYLKAGGENILFSVNSHSVFEKVPLNQDIDLGIIYYAPTCNFVFKVVVDSAYSNEDTLLISNFNYDSPEPRPYIHKIAGPFKDTILPPVFNYSQLQTRYYIDKDKIEVNTDYEIWKGPILSSAGIKIKSGHAEQEPYLNQCNVMDTFLIRIN